MNGTSKILAIAGEEKAAKEGEVWGSDKVV